MQTRATRIFSLGWLDQTVGIAPLVTLRVVIGAMLLISTLRFVALGWVDDHYIQPDFHFKYFGFGWVEALPATWMYALHGLLMVSSLCVMLGLYYRLAAVLQFLLFTYTELIDLTYYLNHYYFVSIACLLLGPRHAEPDRRSGLTVADGPGIAFQMRGRLRNDPATPDAVDSFLPDCLPEWRCWVGVRV